MYTITLNELKGVQKMCAHAGQSGVTNKTSVESTAQDGDFQKVTWRKMHTCNNTLETTKKWDKPVPTPAAVKLPSNATLTRKFFTPLRTTVIDTETISADDTRSEKQAPRKPGRPPAIMMTLPQTSFRSGATLNITSRETTSSEIHKMEPTSKQKQWRTIQP
jgi:hypothetical protein